MDNTDEIVKENFVQIIFKIGRCLDYSLARLQPGFEPSIS
jgi:hypothetical protein